MLRILLVTCLLFGTGYLTTSIGSDVALNGMGGIDDTELCQSASDSDKPEGDLSDAQLNVLDSFAVFTASLPELLADSRSVIDALAWAYTIRGPPASSEI